MLESRFVEQNKQKWAELETLLAKSPQDPEKMSDFFVQVSEDLSYARTHYKNRSVRLYLNQLTQQIFNTVYKNKKNRWKQWVEFWKYELPATMFHARRELLLSLLIFLMSMAIGIFSTHNDPNFPQLILGEDYINMTLENIKKGDPMAVYKKSKQMDMFLGITINNIRVALITFVVGIFLGLGTGGFILYNGIMVGTFQYFFFQRGMAIESSLTIWLHGALEISSIVLAGAAGFCLGNGLLFPGTFSRFQSFQIGARKGIKIMLGIIPIFVIAAFIESFLTRYTEMPDLIRLVLILLSFGFILFYFVIYPAKVIKDPRTALLSLSEKPETVELQTEATLGIRSFGEIFSATLAWIYQYVQPILVLLLVLSTIMSAYWVWWINPSDVRFYHFTQYAMVNNILQYLDFERGGWLWLIPLGFALAFIQTYLFHLYRNRTSFSNSFDLKLHALNFVQNLLLVALPLSLLLVDSSFFRFLFVLLLPFQIFWATTTMCLQRNALSSFFQSLSLAGESWKMVFGQYFIMIFMIFVLSILGTSPIVWLYFQVITWNFADGSEWTEIITRWFVAFLTLTTIFFSYAFVFANSLFLFENLKEINTGDVLRKQILELRVKKGYVH